MSIADLVARYGLLALFLGGGIEGETMVVVGGILAHKGLVSLPGAMAATAAGSFVADQLYFLIGRRLSGWRFVARLKRNPLYARATAMLERHPVGFIFAFRFLYGFRTISPFAIGTSNVSAQLFLVVNAIAAIVWGCTFTLVGYVFGREAERFLGRFEPSLRTVAIGAGMVVVMVFAVHLFRRWRAVRLHPDAPTPTGARMTDPILPAAGDAAVKKVVLAYSGGLDTSVILKWLQTEYGCEVVTFTADLGQGEELEPARAKAELLGIKPQNIFIEDLREEFVRDYVFPMMRANALYEGLYLLGTSIARPLIAKRQIEIAAKVGADAVAHGATGKGNDQVRFELGYYALNPDIKVIAPWREWDLTSRTRLIEFAEQHQIPISKDKRGEAPFSTDANILHTSSEGQVLEDPWEEVPDYVYSRTVNPEDAPDTPEVITIDFERGDGVALNGEGCSPATLVAKLNDLGRAHGIGRLDLVENRFVGMKSRGMYETPGGTIYALAHRGIEQITLDRGAAHLKDELAPRYAELVYNGFWFSPEREMLQAAVDVSQAKVTGTVRLKLYKGSCHVTGRRSPHSLYSEKVVTFEDDQGAYDQRDAAGFIKLNALRLRLLGRRDR